MSVGSRRVMPTGHPSNRHRRFLPHNFLVHLHLRTKVSTIVRILVLNLHIHMVVLHKGVLSVMAAPSVVETSLMFVVRDPLVISSPIRIGMSRESV